MMVDLFLQIFQLTLYYSLMNEKSIVTAMAALAQEFRLRAFRLLVVAGPEGLTPTQIADSLGVAANTLSFHLKELMHADLVTQERQGRNLIYRASFTAMDGVIAYLTQNCCQGSACLNSLSSDQTTCC
jgi:DNA-binding transcriptional ArsR family regulator